MSKKLTLEEINEKVRFWTDGVEIQGDSISELLESLQRVSYERQCEITDGLRNLEPLIKQLDLVEIGAECNECGTKGELDMFEKEDEVGAGHYYQCPKCNSENIYVH